MRLLDPARQVDQLRQLSAMSLVKTIEEMRDECRRRRILPIGRLGSLLLLKAFELVIDLLCPPPLGSDRFAETLSVGATEFRCVLLKDLRCSGETARRLVECVHDRLH